MKEIFSFLLGILVSLLCLATISFAICDGNCVQYCGNPNGSHGYCVDYIQYRLGVSQGGDARTWTGNISVDEVQANDVAIFDFGSYGHVAVVDLIDGNDMVLSEWNWGGQLVPAGNSCGVTNKYGTLLSTSRKIPKTSATRFWRPSGGSNNQEAVLQYRRVGNVAWNPSSKSCLYAERWTFFNLGYPNGGQSMTSNSICQQEEYEMMMALGGVFSNWWNVIYSPSDLVENGICSQ
jgi:hypothetical protein